MAGTISSRFMQSQKKHIMNTAQVLSKLIEIRDWWKKNIFEHGHVHRVPLTTSSVHALPVATEAHAR